MGRMNKARRQRVAMELVQDALLLKGLGILVGSGIRGCYVRADKDTDLLYSVAHVLDVVHMMEREFKIIVDIETSYDKLLRATYLSMNPMTSEKGDRIIAQIRKCT